MTLINYLFILIYSSLIIITIQSFLFFFLVIKNRIFDKKICQNFSNYYLIFREFAYFYKVFYLTIFEVKQILESLIYILILFFNLTNNIFD